MTSHAELNNLIEDTFPLGQRRSMALAALGGLFAALDELQRHGVALGVLPADQVPKPEPQEWPKAVYHIAPEGEAPLAPKVVESQEELDDLGADWTDKVQPHAEHSGRAPQVPQRDASQTPTDPLLARGSGRGVNLLTTQQLRSTTDKPEPHTDDYSGEKA